ncbi:MAG: ATP-dependent Clp protease proteolytic subunit, partial [Streptococcus gallolyticus]|nr:ATP-dependent Clp protease proteolytic subunit [Streptococcus gallolyticus]
FWFTKKSAQNLEQILADNSGQTLEKVHADAERDNWMSAQETLEYGFIDEIMVNNELN